MCIRDSNFSEQKMSLYSFTSKPSLPLFNLRDTAGQPANLLLADSWAEVATLLLTLPHHVSLCFSKMGLTHPLSVGFQPRLALPKGQLGSYEATLVPECFGVLHINEFPEYYEVHRDRWSFNRNPLKHALEDAPEVTFAVALPVFLWLLRRL